MFCLLILLIIWLLWSNLTIGITRHEITSDRLPAAFDGNSSIPVRVNNRPEIISVTLRGIIKVR